ncbi:hypothetical protein FQA39_LY14505 [Lamprigera yunnana]|nr:hypothetical protein FQA39_LY14505 [Lamprigera yunnana]
MRHVTYIHHQPPQYNNLRFYIKACALAETSKKNDMVLRNGWHFTTLPPLRNVAFTLFQIGSVDKRLEEAGNVESLEVNKEIRVEEVAEIQPIDKERKLRPLEAEGREIERKENVRAEDERQGGAENKKQRKWRKEEVNAGVNDEGKVEDSGESLKEADAERSDGEKNIILLETNKGTETEQDVNERVVVVVVVVVELQFGPEQNHFQHWL